MSYNQKAINSTMHACNQNTTISNDQTTVSTDWQFTSSRHPLCFSAWKTGQSIKHQAEKMSKGWLLELLGLYQQLAV